MDIEGAQPRTWVKQEVSPENARDAALLRKIGELTQVQYTNRNRLNNGDIVGMTNDSPMVLNQSFKPPSKRIMRIDDAAMVPKRQSMPQSPRSSIKIVNSPQHAPNLLAHEVIEP